MFLQSTLSGDFRELFQRLPSFGFNILELRSRAFSITIPPYLLPAKVGFNSVQRPNRLNFDTHAPRSGPWPTPINASMSSVYAQFGPAAFDSLFAAETLPVSAKNFRSSWTRPNVLVILRRNIGRARVKTPRVCRTIARIVRFPRPLRGSCFRRHASFAEVQRW